MITVSLVGAAIRAQRFVGFEARLRQRLADMSRNPLIPTLSPSERGRGPARKRWEGEGGAALARLKKRAFLSADDVAALDAAVMGELEA